MLAQKNPYIESAYEHLQVISQDREKRLGYEARQKAIRDHNQMMLEAEERGKAAGERIGRQQSADCINRLNALLIKERRFEDLERSTKDEGFQEQLMLRYGIKDAL